MEESGTETYNEEQPIYVPPELVNSSSKACRINKYHCYLMELKQNFRYHVSAHDVVLATRSELDSETFAAPFELCTEWGDLTVQLRYAGTVDLSPVDVQRCRRFQINLFRILLDRNTSYPESGSDELCNLCEGDNPDIDYLLLPATARHGRPSNSIVDWECVNSASEGISECTIQAHKKLRTKNGLVCSCKLENSLVSTPHNGLIYVITGSLKLDGNSILRGKRATYKEFFAKKQIKLQYEHQKLLKARSVFKVKNYVLGCRKRRKRGPSEMHVELPPELCSIIMSPISINTIYSFSFIPSIMHQLESLLLAFNLKKMLQDHCTQNDINIPITKVLEAITTKECQESLNYDSLEALGDSFLKYAASQQVFKTYQNEREGFLTDERKKLISNIALCKLGSNHRLPGFIRNGRFDAKNWIIPGDKSGIVSIEEELVSSRTKVYVRGKRKLNYKIVADVVEALIGAFLSTQGEEAALLFMNWIGIKVDFTNVPYERNFSVKAEGIIENVNILKSRLNDYSFHDSSLLVEALTHGSYKRPEFPVSYQRLEYLGDAVLDYVITMHFYKEYHNISPGMLTDMRSASANNECYAFSAIRAELHKHMLYHSQPLDKQISDSVDEVEKEKLSREITYGWQLDTSFPSVLADVIESLAGAIYIDSGYNADVVFQSMRPLLEPLVTPDTRELQPVRELIELCDKGEYIRANPVVCRENGVTSVTIKVNVNGFMHESTRTASNQVRAEMLACKEVLRSLKETISKE